MVNGALSFHQWSIAYLSQSEEENVASSNFAPYDQYEVSIPMDIAGDCLQMASRQTAVLRMFDRFTRGYY
ncbi:hypothetical protein MMC08_000702, partial [Hypocenomyce scalaris]|nr:hypothetical protein [Hypocenomyce scalaris]